MLPQPSSGSPRVPPRPPRRGRRGAELNLPMIPSQTPSSQAVEDRFWGQTSCLEAARVTALFPPSRRIRGLRFWGPHLAAVLCSFSLNLSLLFCSDPAVSAR